MALPFSSVAAFLVVGGGIYNNVQTNGLGYRRLPDSPSLKASHKPLRVLTHCKNRLVPVVPNFYCFIDSQSRYYCFLLLR